MCVLSLSLSLSHSQRPTQGRYNVRKHNDQTNFLVIANDSSVRVRVEIQRTRKRV